MTRYFKGFSTIEKRKQRQRIYYDLDLIRFDLLNHFNTKVGERAMRPTWGCRIWDWLMDPLTPSLRDEIVREAISICEADARVAVQGVQVAAMDNGVRVDISLEYRPFGLVENFAIEFDRREEARWNNGN